MGDNAYREVTELLARRRRRAEEDADLRRDELYGSLPQLRQFDAEIAGVCRQMTAAALEGEPTEKYHAALERIKQERRQTLAEAGIAEDLLLPDIPARCAEIPALWTAGAAAACSSFCGRDPLLHCRQGFWRTAAALRILI